MPKKIILDIINNTDHRYLFKEKLNLILLTIKEIFNMNSTIFVELSIESPEIIRQLNKKYRKIDKTTDVLSFGYDNFNSDVELPILHLGEIYINYNRVKEQAKEFGHSIKREFCYLFTHACLHLLGFDHIEDKEAYEMNLIANEIMEKINVGRV